MSKITSMIRTKSISKPQPSPMSGDWHGNGTMGVGLGLQRQPALASSEVQTLLTSEARTFPRSELRENGCPKGG